MHWATCVSSFSWSTETKKSFRSAPQSTPARSHSPSTPSFHTLLPHLAHRVPRRAPSPISKVGVIEYRLVNRFQPLKQRLLAYPIIDCRYSQPAPLARLAARLRDRSLPHRLRLIGLRSQLLPLPFQLLVKLRAISLQTLPIHTTATPIGPDPPPRPAPDSSSDRPGQLMNGPSLHPSG
jgi:hypothetical protein